MNQREVGNDTHSFAEGLKHIFRQNPDVIVIGELRDRESFEIALSAAGTGHLVLATMHSLSATATVDRIIDMFPGDQQAQVRAQLAESLLLVHLAAAGAARRGDGPRARHREAGDLEPGQERHPRRQGAPAARA